MNSQEYLNEGNFTTTTKWTAAPDFSFSGGKAVYTHGSGGGGGGELYQLATNMAIPPTGDTLYRFTYTASDYAAPDADRPPTLLLYATAGFVTTSITLDATNGAKTMYFMSKSSLGTKFYLVGQSEVAGSTFKLDDLSLKSITTTISDGAKANFLDTKALVVGTGESFDKLDSGDAYFSGNLEIGGYIDMKNSGNLKIGNAYTGGLITTGIKNVLVGANTGKMITTGYKNTCIGDLSCEALTTGAFNVMLAGFSGADTMTGDGNTEVGGHTSLVGDTSFNSLFGFEANAPQSYSEYYYTTGEYNTFLGGHTGAQGHYAGGSTNYNLADHVTLVGWGASIGQAPWLKVGSVTNSGGNVRITTTANHGWSDGDFVAMRDFEPAEILLLPTGGGTVCALASYTVYYFKIVNAATNVFDLQWCRSANGTTNNWSGTTCGGWNTAEYMASFTDSFSNTTNFSSCSPIDDTGAFVSKSKATVYNADFTTVIGANAVGNCSDCVVLGRSGDLVGIGQPSPTETLDVNGSAKISGAVAIYGDTSMMSSSILNITSASKLNINGSLAYTYSSVSMSGNTLTPVGTYNRVDSGVVGSTNLNTINGCDAANSGKLLTLFIIPGGKTVVVKHGTGNIFLNGLVDFTLDSIADRLTLQCDSIVGGWVMVNGSNNL